MAGDWYMSVSWGAVGVGDVGGRRALGRQGWGT